MLLEHKGDSVPGDTIHFFSSFYGLAFTSGSSAFFHKRGIMKDFNFQTGAILNDRIAQPLRRKSSKNLPSIGLNPNRCPSRHLMAKRQVVR